MQETNIRKRLITMVKTKRSSKEELVDIPLKDDESGDSGIVDAKVDLECGGVETLTSLSPTLTSPPKESRLAILLEVSVPFLLAGFGCVLAGLLLDVVEVCILSTVIYCMCVIFTSIGHCLMRYLSCTLWSLHFWVLKGTWK